MRELDRAVLRNIVIVVVTSTTGLILVGTTLLQRDRSRLDASLTLERDAARSSVGGVSPGTPGTTTITSAPLGRADSAAGTPAPTAAPAPRSNAFEVPNGEPPPGLRGFVPPYPGMPMPSAMPDGRPPPNMPPYPAMPPYQGMPPNQGMPMPPPQGFTAPPGFAPPSSFAAPPYRVAPPNGGDRGVAPADAGFAPPASSAVPNPRMAPADGGHAMPFPDAGD